MLNRRGPSPERGLAAIDRDQPAAGTSRLRARARRSCTSACASAVLAELGSRAGADDAPARPAGAIVLRSATARSMSSRSFAAWRSATCRAADACSCSFISARVFLLVERLQLRRAPSLPLRTIRRPTSLFMSIERELRVLPGTAPAAAASARGLGRSRRRRGGVICERLRLSAGGGRRLGERGSGRRRDQRQRRAASFKHVSSNNSLRRVDTNPCRTAVEPPAY